MEALRHDAEGRSRKKSHNENEINII